jgi:hypothetical protein
MSEELIYSYPQDGDTSEFEEIFQKAYAVKSKNLRKILIMSCTAFLFFLLYSLPIFAKIDWLFLILGIAILIFSLLFAKQVKKESGFTLLGIVADEEQMRLTYFSGKSKKTLTVFYEDIRSARFTDDDFTSFQIVFENSDKSFVKEYDLNGNEISPLSRNLFIFSLNPESYEQYFFLYVAEELFTVEKLKKTKKFFKRFGNAQEYIDRITEKDGE